jgi:hypothetical protein
MGICPQFPLQHLAHLLFDNHATVKQTAPDYSNKVILCSLSRMCGYDFLGSWKCENKVAEANEATY